MAFILNAMARFGQPLSDSEKVFVGEDAPQFVRPFLSLWGDTAPTPLIQLSEIAADIRVHSVLIKNEGLRLNQGSFKSLGGAYAVMVLFKRQLEQHLGQDVRIAQLVSPTARAFASGVTVCCATDGNHGKSVAAGARLLGCKSVIFLHAAVSQSRAEAIGADEVIRVDGSYDDAVKEAERISRDRNWLLVSDTSWPGYEDTPGLVAQGYTVLAEEALQQATAQGHAHPTHVFLQAGVGGFASSIAGYLTERVGAGTLKTIIVEPDRAACLYSSARLGELTSIPPGEPTVMAMLECHTPSLMAWRILEKIADGFMTITDEQATDAMRRLAFRGEGEPIVAGESGAAGLAGLLAAAANTELCSALALGPDSRVLVINTETATDPSSYTRIVGRTSAAVAAAGQASASA